MYPLLYCMVLETQIAAMADTEGQISKERNKAGEPEVDININIRDDEMTIYETESGQHLLQTPEMEAGVYLKPIPTKNGFTPEVVLNPSGTLTETATAEPAEQPDVSSTSSINVRMD